MGNIITLFTKGVKIPVKHEHNIPGLSIVVVHSPFDVFCNACAALGIAFLFVAMSQTFISPSIIQMFGDTIGSLVAFGINSVSSYYIGRYVTKYLFEL